MIHRDPTGIIFGHTPDNDDGITVMPRIIAHAPRGASFTCTVFTHPFAAFSAPS